MTQSTNNPEIRKAYLLNKYVIIAPNRSKRPIEHYESITVNQENSCPFCDEHVDESGFIDKIMVDGQWAVASLKNAFPVLSNENIHAYGYQEVIIDTPKHSSELADLSEKEIRNLLEMYAKRTVSLSKDPKIDYILCFKNQGKNAGASMVHPHSQVFASKLLPPQVEEELRLARAYKKTHKTCPYCHIISKELNGPRKIWEDNFSCAFTPYASEYHYEAWVFLKKHLDNISAASDLELSSLARVLKIILLKLKKLDLPFNMYLHQVVSDKDQHFYIKIQPRDSVWAGLELGSGLIINSVSPEMAASFYRE